MSYIPNCRHKYTKDCEIPFRKREDIPDNEINEYWYGLLQGNDREFIAGFDWCVEMCLNNLFDNIDIYNDDLKDFDIDAYELDRNIVNGAYDEHNITFNDEFGDTRECKWYVEYSEEELAKMSKQTRLMLFFKWMVNHYIEQERDMLVTSMIEDMNEDVHTAAVEKAKTE